MHTRFSYMLYDDSNYHIGRARINVLLNEIEYVTTRWWAWTVYVFILFIFEGGGVNAVKIRTLTVPEYVELNNTNNEEDVNEDIFLDCAKNMRSLTSSSLMSSILASRHVKQNQLSWPIMAPILHMECAHIYYCIV